MWQIDFVGPLYKSLRGNKYLITAIDYCTSKAIAIPLPARSHEAAIRLLEEEIIWTYGKPAMVIHDNGEEFLSKEFRATCKRYGIKPQRTTPGHPQSNGKVERLNYELIQRLQRIAIEGKDARNWDKYLPRALFAFHAHPNSRTGVTPFQLLHGTEPILPSTDAATPPTTVEIAEALEHRRTHIQDLTKYRAATQDKYRDSMVKLASDREEYAAKEGIQEGDLVMRKVLNRQTKLDPKWDGPWVVVAANDKDVYQLAGPNGYILQNLVNNLRLRRLTLPEIERYTGEFWNASERVKLHDERMKDDKALKDLNKRAAELTIEVLEAQRQGRPAPLDRYTEITAQRRLIETQRAALPQAAPTTTPDAPSTDPDGSVISESESEDQQVPPGLPPETTSDAASTSATAPRRSERARKPSRRFE
jgi:hypothetical protein